MTPSLFLLLIVVLGLVGGMIFYMRPEPEPAAAEPVRKNWTSEHVTPLAMGPRNRVAERVARGPVLSQAVLVAVGMARADGHILDEEENAIRMFILNHVTDADNAFADQVMRDGLSRDHTDHETEEAVDTIRAVASEEQRRLIIQLLAHVASVDGNIDEAERVYMRKIGKRLGLSQPAVDHLLKAMSKMAGSTV
jgi:uncharacterized tellurite resistance protein B-like protein